MLFESRACFHHEKPKFYYGYMKNSVHGKLFLISQVKLFKSNQKPLFCEHELLMMTNLLTSEVTLFHYNKMYQFFIKRD